MWVKEALRVLQFMVEGSVAGFTAAPCSQPAAPQLAPPSAAQQPKQTQLNNQGSTTAAPAPSPLLASSLHPPPAAPKSPGWLPPPAPRHTRHTSHVTRHALHVTRHTSHATRHALHVTHHTSHVTRHTSQLARTAAAPPTHLIRPLLPLRLEKARERCKHLRVPRLPQLHGSMLRRS